MTFKIIEPNVEVLDIRPSEDNTRERSNETVITNIKLMHQRQLRKAIRNDTAKPVRIQMEHSNICHQTKLGRQVPSDIRTVEVNTSYNRDVRIIKSRCTDHTGVVAHVRTMPVSCGVKWVGIYCFFPSLESNVSFFKP